MLCPTWWYLMVLTSQLLLNRELARFTALPIHKEIVICVHCTVGWVDLGF